MVDHALVEEPYQKGAGYVQQISRLARCELRAIGNKGDHLAASDMGEDIQYVVAP